MTDRYLVQGLDSEGWPVSTDVYPTYWEAVNQTMNLESAGLHGKCMNSIILRVNMKLLWRVDHA